MRLVIRLNLLLLISKPLFLADILRSLKNFSWRRLMFSCIRYVLLRLERSMFKCKLDPSVLYFLTFFQMVILLAKLSRKRCSINNLWPQILCTLVFKRNFRGFENWMNWLVAIAISSKLSRNCASLKCYFFAASTLLIPFT